MRRHPRSRISATYSTPDSHTTAITFSSVARSNAGAPAEEPTPPSVSPEKWELPAPESPVRENRPLGLTWRGLETNLRFGY